MSRRGGFIEGFLFGAISGIALGVLFAPHSGEETRSKIKDLKDDSETLIKGSKEKTETLITKTKESIEKGFEKLSQIIEDNKQTTGVETPISTKKKPG